MRRLIVFPEATPTAHPTRGTLRGRARWRGAVLAGLALVLLLLLVPTAGAVLDPTDTATGTGALANEAGGILNTADGYFALNQNTTGFANTAVGARALGSNTVGDSNTAAGLDALRDNTTGIFNTAVGRLALTSNTTGSQNMAAGAVALGNNFTGSANTAVGLLALFDNSTGSNNTALGFRAGLTATPANSNRTGSNNTFLGYNAGPGTTTQLNGATAIGAGALVSASNALVLGAPGTQVGINTQTPQSLLQLRGKPDSYGDYLQLPLVTSDLGPPAADCNATTFVGRLALQYKAVKARTTLWVCSGAGVWKELAKSS